MLQITICEAQLPIKPFTTKETTLDIRNVYQSLLITFSDIYTI